MRLRQHISATLLLTFVINASAQTAGPALRPAPRHNLMPVPASVRLGTGRLAVTNSSTVAARGPTDEGLGGGVEGALRRLEGRTVLELPLELANDAGAAALVVDCKGPGQAVPSVEEDESYSLDVSDKIGRAHV